MPFILHTVLLHYVYRWDGIAILQIRLLFFSCNYSLDHNCTVLFTKFQFGSTPALIKAEVPWSARRGNLSEKERVLKTVKG
jgi:hypothetical protein